MRGRSAGGKQDGWPAGLGSGDVEIELAFHRRWQSQDNPAASLPTQPKQAGVAADAHAGGGCCLAAGGRLAARPRRRAHHLCSAGQLGAGAAGEEGGGREGLMTVSHVRDMARERNVTLDTLNDFVNPGSRS